MEHAALCFYGNQSSNHGSHFCTNYKQELYVIFSYTQGIIYSIITSVFIYVHVQYFKNDIS